MAVVPGTRAVSLREVGNVLDRIHGADRPRDTQPGIRLNAQLRERLRASLGSCRRAGQAESQSESEELRESCFHNNSRKHGKCLGAVFTKT